MIKLYRVWAMVIRHLILYFRDLDKVNTFFYWPLTNIMAFGLIAYSSSNANHEAVAKALMAITIWQIMMRISLEVAKIVLQELLSHNIVNVLATPLTFGEWVLTGMILGSITSVIVAFSCMMWSYLLFGIMLWKTGLILIPIFLLVPISGFIFGFFIAGLFMLMGMGAIDLMYSIIWMAAPFSGAYAPLSILPLWMQKIAWLMPYAYIFEGLRMYQTSAIIDWQMLAVGFILNVIYCAAGIWFFWCAFNKSKVLGIARLG